MSKKRKKKLPLPLLIILLILAVVFSTPANEETGSDPLPSETSSAILEQDPTDIPAKSDLPDPDGSYTNQEDVALFIHVYDRLPNNFITKEEARKLGWNGGGLESYAPGMCIGGDRFGNYEGLLPSASGRQYYECDIDTLGAESRGAKRIVFSNDGLVYYTGDHYNTFELLYGEP